MNLPVVKNLVLAVELFGSNVPAAQAPGRRGRIAHWVVDAVIGIQLQMLTQPIGELDLVQGAVGEAKHAGVFFLVTGNQVGTIEHQERAVADMCGALVAVDERVIASQSACQACSKSGDVCRWIGVSECLLRTRESRVRQGFISHARIAPMLRELAVVDGQRELLFNPDDHGCRSLSELVQDMAIFAHDLFGHFHLRGGMRARSRACEHGICPY